MVLGRASAHLVYFLEEVKQAAGAPSLSVAGVAAVFPVRIRQFRDSSPWVLLYMFARLKEDLVQVMESLGGILAIVAQLRSVTDALVNDERTFFPAPTFVSK